MSRRYYFVWLVGFFIVQYTYAQHHLPIHESDGISQLIHLKKELSKKSELKEFYRIQLFSGPRQEAEEHIKAFSRLDIALDSDIIYETPNFKVWVGFFRNRLDAERYLLNLKDDFPKALILKPGRS